ncbi:PMS1 protein homolog 1 isoform X1 [Grus americana]|nr:PMS1 protein homolog 1 isoform X1 [Grus americana]XP_054685165.1 PMS1 protein homolog 1 isoform X1 [Grus americana]XP_054685166.1 PMS1 protein homolog 1 isoform X1 [Grus americana]XP_054685168.1 PMS1 protein homolog 1 isoform X1 [Grus americana]XP_054685169.1 PMS1 protein homolog 1 isoform X1 [Grus americana]XP_054685170.1 PMS1 protein homolog 1 isoform X1 [Grus americana]
MKQLSAETIRLLSSSQVITSIASVVKELIENSLDASATNIDIKLENYGFNKIEVRDNGSGIKVTDVPVMAIKHYTSKISSSEDLERLTTYGFRGEALGSICCISEVLVTTKTADDDFSTQYTLDSNGHVTSKKPSHLGQGTTVTVLKLFQNLPVRKQFYSTNRKCKEELRKVQDLLIAYGIIKPDLRITLTHNKAVIWQKTRVSDHKMACMSVLGTAVMGSMVPFQHCCEDPEINLSGFLPKAESNSSLTSLSSSERSFIFINNRPVHQKEILKLIRQYYSLVTHKDCTRLYPVFFLNITVPASAVDVNLTPDKTQVLLHYKESVLLAVENVLKSLYGPLPATVPGESNKTDVTSEDMFVYRTEQTDVVVNEMRPSGNDDLHARTSFLSFSSDVQNCQAGKNAEICLNHQTFCGDDVHSCLDKKEVSKSDAFPDSSLNLLCEKEQNGQNMTDIQSNSVPVDPKSKKADEHLLSSDNIDEVEKNEEALVPKDLPEISADNWSMGSGFKNHLGGNLEPVKILIPQVGGKINKENEHTGEQSNDPQISNQSIKKRNVISEKFGHVTAYDLISSRIIKKPKSAIGFFTEECRPKLIADNPKSSMEDILLKIEEQWKNLNEEEKKHYELKAAKDLERYDREAKKAMGQAAHQPTKEAEKKKPKLKNSPPGQQKLDKILHAQIEKKWKPQEPVKIVTVPFSLSSCRRHLQRHEKNYSDEHELFQIHRQSFPDVWIFATEKKLMLLNPYRLEEALLHKRLLMNHKLPVEKLDKPIVLTDSVLGGSQYMAALHKMEKDYQSFSGLGYLTDPRLVANGFQIKVIEGASATESHLEIEGMANCLPYYGTSDLKEVLNAVVNGNAKEVYECRPLKVINYLEGEAVRLTRQLPLHLSKEDVQNTIYRMKQQLGKENKGCVHGRPFFHHLTDIPEVDKQNSTEIIQ